MTRAAIQRRIKYFQSRVRATMPGTAAHTRARNLLSVAERMLLCHHATGSVAGWHKYHIPERGLHMDTIALIANAMDAARRKLSRGEQLMLIDIYNGTILSPAHLGSGLLAQVADALADVPGQYEAKWSVDGEAMLQKIRSLSQLDAALIELWAAGYWQLHDTVEDSLNAYLRGSLTIATHIESVVATLDDVSERLAKTRSAFKSATVAEARALVEQAAERLRLGA